MCYKYYVICILKNRVCCPHIVSYPINKEGDVSFVAVIKEDYQFKESWKEKGSISDLLDDFSAYDPKIFFGSLYRFQEQ